MLAIGISGIAIGLICALGGFALFGILFFSGMLPIIAASGIILYLIFITFGIGLSLVSYKFLKQKRWALKTLRVILIIIAIGTGILSLYQLICVVQSGLEPIEILKMLVLLVTIGILAVVSFHLQTTAVKSIFYADVESGEPNFITKCNKILVAGILLVFIGLLIPLGISFLSIEDWPFIRAKIAEKTGGTEYALGLYAKTMVEANSQSLKDKARGAISKLQFSIALKHYYKSEFNQAVEILSLLAQNPLDLDKETREELPEKLYTYGMELKDKKQWSLSRNLFVSLVKNYPAHMRAEKAGEFQKWYFDKIIMTETKDNIPIPVYQLTKAGLKKIREENYTASAGTRLLFLKLTIAHFGRTTKELQADNFELRGENNQTSQCLGFKTEYGIEKIWNNKSVTIGPDPVEITLIFEIPKEEKRFKLVMFGDGVTKVDLKT